MPLPIALFSPALYFSFCHENYYNIHKSTGKKLSLRSGLVGLDNAAIVGC
jgi:hypothetical protein